MHDLFLYAGVDRLRAPVLLFDAVGLSFFAVAGAQKAIMFGWSPVMSALLGMVTGIGGGMTPDVLLMEIPQVLRSDLYAVAALAARCGRCCRACARPFLWRISFHRRNFVPGPAFDGDQARLAFAGRASVRTRTRGNGSLGR